MKEDEEWLTEKLQQLPTTQRTLIYMRQVERRSHEEIASLLGIEKTSVSTLLARARRTLLEDIKRRNNL
jgi:RNA polymerase sigma-70 factor (ECF subfamily)